MDGGEGQPQTKIATAASNPNGAAMGQPGERQSRFRPRFAPPAQAEIEEAENGPPPRGVFPIGSP